MNCFFKKMVQSRPLFVYFRPFLITISIIQIKKGQMVCLRYKPVAAGWQAQTKPQSFGGRPKMNCFRITVYAVLRLKQDIRYKMMRLRTRFGKMLTSTLAFKAIKPSLLALVSCGEIISVLTGQENIRTTKEWLNCPIYKCGYIIG